MKNGIYLSVAILTLALLGCDKDRDEKENRHDQFATTSTTEKYTKNAPSVAGKWVGTWKSTKNKGHGGGLSCEAVEKAKNEWEAVFTAEYGKTSSYNVNLKGKPEGDKVVFGGKVDLGEKGGGVFNWTGRANATEFTGEYEAAATRVRSR